MTQEQARQAQDKVRDLVGSLAEGNHWTLGLTRHGDGYAVRVQSSEPQVLGSLPQSVDGVPLVLEAWPGPARVSAY